MDRHDGMELTPEEMAIAHQRDLDVQARYDVQYHTYWYDPDAGTVFCLMEGPNRDAVDAVHREAHDASASAIIELPHGMPLEHLFGALPNQSDDRATITPAIRAIMFTDMCGSVAQTHQLGDDGHMTFAAGARSGRSLLRWPCITVARSSTPATGSWPSFTSVASAVAFAIDVQRGVHARNDEGPNAARSQHRHQRRRTGHQ